MTENKKLLLWAGGLSVAAGIVHGALTEEHLEESIAIGAFFVLAALAQALFGFVILSSHLMNGAPISVSWPLRARRFWYGAGIAGNALLVWVYLASRTTGFFGVYEAWDGIGIFTKLIEVALVVVLGLLLTATRPFGAPNAAAKTA